MGQEEGVGNQPSKANPHVSKNTHSIYENYVNFNTPLPKT